MSGLDFDLDPNILPLMVTEIWAFKKLMTSHYLLYDVTYNCDINQNLPLIDDYHILLYSLDHSVIKFDLDRDLYLDLY